MREDEKRAKGRPRPRPKDREEESGRRPVLLKEALQLLRPSPGDVFLDGTVGLGGHSQAIAARILPDGLLIGLDRDPDALEAAAARLAGFGDRVRLHSMNYRDFPDALAREGVSYLDGALFDLGVSPLQLTDPSRGFSFMDDGPLDMRMDRKGRPTAEEVVNGASQGELQKMLLELGGETFATRIARRIVQSRGRKRIRTTQDLARIVVQAYPPGRRRIHPATKTFQAIRMVVNREVEAIQAALKQIPRYLRTGARVAVIAFHSGEDRLVKEFVRTAAREGEMNELTRKPIRPTPDEVRLNRWARSACLRVAERCR